MWYSCQISPAALLQYVCMREKESHIRERDIRRERHVGVGMDKSIQSYLAVLTCVFLPNPVTGIIVRRDTISLKKTHTCWDTRTHKPMHTHTHTHTGWTEMAWGLVIRSIAQENCVNGLLWMSWCDGERVWINKEPIKCWQPATVCSQSFTPPACVQLYNMSVKET